jgi:hypothetical protein
MPTVSRETVRVWISATVAHPLATMAARMAATNFVRFGFSVVPPSKVFLRGLCLATSM